MKIKVHPQACQGKKQYQRDVSTGNFDLDVLSTDEVENNPQKYDVAESTADGRDILRESLTLGKGWIKLHEARPMKARAAVPPPSAPPVVQDEAFREATRKRIHNAYKALGIAEAETDDESTDRLVECWARILGSEEAAKAFVKGPKR
jgi:hypothetical protein